ncbi:MAG: lipopolysaccharide biosynthesis protein [Gemmataceae bacterium]
MSLRLIVRGTAAMSSVNVLRILAQFIAVPILSRLLSPTDYGLVGIAMPFVLFAMMIADAGVGMSLVRTPAREREEWSTCFWLSVLFGLVLAILSFGLAPLAAQLFGEPPLKSILRALAIGVFAQAVFLVPRAAQQQSDHFTTIAGTEIAAIFTGIAAAVAIGLYGGGAWALVGQQLAFFVVRLLLTLYLSPFRPVFAFDLQKAKSHLVFGRDVLTTNIVGFITRSVDSLVIGWVLGTASVGIYTMATQFARLPTMLIAGPLQYVLYGQLVKVKNDPEAVTKTFFALTRVLAILVLPAVGMVAVAHQPVFTFLLSPKWEFAGFLFMLIAPACALQAVTGIGGTVRMALGRMDIVLRMAVEFGILWVVVLSLAVAHGLTSTAAAYNLAVLLYFPRSLGFVLPIVGGTKLSYLGSLAVPAIATAICAGVFVVCTGVATLGSPAQLVLAATLTILAILGSWFMQRHYVRSEVGYLTQALHRAADSSATGATPAL